MRYFFIFFLLCILSCEKSAKQGEGRSTSSADKNCSSPDEFKEEELFSTKSKKGCSL